MGTDDAPLPTVLIAMLRLKLFHRVWHSSQSFVRRQFQPPCNCIGNYWYCPAEDNFSICGYVYLNNNSIDTLCNINLLVFSLPYVLPKEYTVPSRKRARYGISAHPPLWAQFPAKV